MTTAKTRAEAFAKAQNEKKLVLLMVCSNTCPQCKAGEQLLNCIQPKVRQWLDAAYVLWRADAYDPPAARKEWNEYASSGSAMPVWVWITPGNGRRVYRRNGLPPANNLRLWLETQAKKYLGKVVLGPAPTEETVP